MHRVRRVLHSSWVTPRLGREREPTLRGAREQENMLIVRMLEYLARVCHYCWVVKVVFEVE